MSSHVSKADVIKRSIKLARAISNRAEDRPLKEHKYLFVENEKNDLSISMSGSANQVLFGRRGTGKTMLLQKLERDASPYNPSGNCIAIMVQAPDFLRSPGTTEKDPPSIRARSQFREFLYILAEKLVDAGDKLVADDNLLGRLGIKKRKRDILEEKILTINQILQNGVRIYHPASSNFVEKIEESTTADHKASMEGAIRAKAGIDNKMPIPTLDLQSELSTTSKGDFSDSLKSSVNKSRTGHYDLGVPELRLKLREIVEILGFQQVMILLDEWQAIPIDCQPEFAELLNRCFFGIECVSVKIAAYRHVCRFNNGGSRDNFRGIELGQDAEVVGDMELPPAEDFTKRHLFDILYRRLIYKEPLLKKYYGAPDQFDYKNLIHDFFHNAHAADMLVRGCHGISRDFIEAFNHAAAYSDDDVPHNKITLQYVEKAYGAISQEIQDNIHTADDIGGFLFEIVKPHIHTTGCPYFFLSKNDHMWDSQLWELIEKRAVHGIPASNMPPGSDADWRGYEVTYGLFHQWRIADNFVRRKNDGRMKWVDVSDLDSDDFSRHVLNVERVPAVTRVCSKCKNQFSTNCHPFITARLCPMCYAEQKD